MSYPITDIDGIEREEAAALKAAGIRTTAGLLEAAKDQKGRKALSEKTQIPARRLLNFANMADRMRIKGLGKDYAALLPMAGVDTVRELKYRNPAKLAKAMAEANAKGKRVELLPSGKRVGRWIESAKKLPPKITY